MNGAIAPRLAEAPARRHPPADRAGIRVPPVGRLDGSRAGPPTVFISPSPTRARWPRCSSGPTSPPSPTSGRPDGSTSSTARSSISSAPAEGPDARIAQVARVAVDAARAPPVPVRAARRPVAARRVGRDRESDGSEAENTRNIAYHYDVSNAFYALWLDRDMVYTCAYFHNWSDDLDAAQRQKLDMTCRKLRLQPGETLLDIGSGWGSLACHAAEHYGVKALGVTLSEEQIALAREKAERRGLSDKVTFESATTRCSRATAYSTRSCRSACSSMSASPISTNYFKTVQRLLKPGGLYLHHAITRPGGSHAARTGKKRPEFQALTRYIFPGGELDYLGRTSPISNSPGSRSATSSAGASITSSPPASGTIAFGRGGTRRSPRSARRRRGSGSPTSPPARSLSSATTPASTRRWR